MIWQSSVKLDANEPTGFLTSFPSSKTKSFVIMSIICLFSGISIAFAANNAVRTSLVEMPEYISFASFVTLICTIVTSYPGI